MYLAKAVILQLTLCDIQAWGPILVLQWYIHICSYMCVYTVERLTFSLQICLNFRHNIFIHFSDYIENTLKRYIPFFLCLLNIMHILILPYISFLWNGSWCSQLLLFFFTCPTYSHSQRPHCMVGSCPSLQGCGVSLEIDHSGHQLFNEISK